MKDVTDELQGARTGNQELFYDLEDSSAVLGWSSHELFGIAARLKIAGNTGDSATLIKICELLKLDQERFAAYAEEVKSGRITRVGLQ